MKIVDRKTFLGMPDGTIFMKVPSQVGFPKTADLAFSGKLEVKAGSLNNDFIVQSLFPHFEETDTGLEWVDAMFAMIGGEESAPLDYESTHRDGLFDDDQLFAVWSNEDAQRLVARLQQALKDGYTTEGQS